MGALAQKREEETDLQIGLNERVATLQSLMCEANENPKRLIELQAYLNNNPDLCNKISVLANAAKEDLLGRIVTKGGSQVVVREEMEGLRNNLTNKNSTPLEMLLIDAVVMCWLRLQYAEGYRSCFMSGEHSFAQLDFAEKMLTRAHNRFNKAIESLARLRRLNRPKNKDSVDRSMKNAKTINAVSRSR